MTRLDLLSAGRAVTAPLQGLRALRALTRGAATNAGQALAEVRRAVTDRGALTGTLSEEAGAGHLQQLDEETCWALLGTQQVGRLAYVARAGRPDIAPVNYTVDDRSVLVRSGVGPKLQAAERRDRVAFEVDVHDPQDRSGWSVVVHGRAEVLPPETGRSDDPLPWASGPRRHVMRVVPDKVTGRLLHGTGAHDASTSGG